MITLYGFGSAFGLPDASPFVTKVEMLLKLAGLSYQKNPNGYRKAPKGKLPYIDDDGIVIADSTFIRWHIERKYGFDFEAGLSAQQRGVAWALEKLLEDHLYWIVTQARWLDDANFARGPAQFFAKIPQPMRAVVTHFVRNKVRANLKAHGMGRLAPAEQLVLAEKALASVADVLDDKPFLMGDDPCGADASVYGFVAGALSPHFTVPWSDCAVSHPNLAAYIERVHQRYFPAILA